MTKKFHLQICLHEQSWESNMKKISTMLNEMLMWEIQCRFGHNSTAGPTFPLLAYYTVTENCKISNDLPRLVWQKNFPTHPRLGYYTASVIFIFTAIIAKELFSPSSLLSSLLPSCHQGSSSHDAPRQCSINTDIIKKIFNRFFRNRHNVYIND